MSESEAYEVLHDRLQKMEAHIQEQDTEIYRLSTRVDKLVSAMQVQKMQVEALAGGGAGGADTMPADEKPPHY